MRIEGVFNPDYSAENYEAKCQAMLDQMREWLRKNKGSIKVQFNHPPGTVICATLADAIANKFVSVNDQAFGLFRQLGWLAGNDQPTVLQTRAVLESITEELKNES